jgi:hypothetical protein
MCVAVDASFLQSASLVGRHRLLFSLAVTQAAMALIVNGGVREKEINP